MSFSPLSHGLWAVTAPPAPDLSTLQEGLTVDVAVVGAGFTGLSAALSLAREGASVAVLEAEEIGFGGSGRNVGLVNAGLWMRPDDICKALGPKHGERLLERLGNGPHEVFRLIESFGIACEANPAGTLHCAADEAGLADLRRREIEWQRRRAPVELLDRQETARLVGSPAYAGALLDRRAGTLQPLAYVRGLARAALAHGARIFVRSPVQTMQRTSGLWDLRTAKGRVRAERLVLASNLYSAAATAPIASEMVCLPYFNFSTPPLDDELRRTILPEAHGAWDTKTVLTSIRLDAEGRLVIGSVGALRAGGLGLHKAWAQRTMHRLFPVLRGIGFEHGWYGWIGMTDDSIPRLHAPGDGSVTICGYNGRGISPGTVFGQILADYVAGRTGEADLPLPVTPVHLPLARGARSLVVEAGAQAAHFVGARALPLSGQ
ncbi:Gamma-glutamylputrescine oxidoreductase [Hartmannibacter diazotrophicus]|uniref:Gamma-glutamylputrescine oxidoreductase n=1 Tax=Hartmannibacter diazotrophicus TaxID=1482074 RepID=A0A2C9DD20_9HYPH|nr:FAD-binding oxidoreductase [Hartmannibacter diazotrophicus]SON58232.1 Gamma-glutamylputrescine oxidoreductase [Hartmannibacter diazotrophicus]